MDPQTRNDPLTMVQKPTFTAKQGQYLAFIHTYTKLHGIAPAFADIQHYFKVAPSTTNQMIKTLEQKGWIEKTARGRPQHSGHPA